MSKAMILAAGFGTRLGQITQKVPKCLVEVYGSTLLEYVVNNLKKAGVTQVMINLHHLPEQVRAFVSKRKSFGITIEFSQEAQILGTGGGIKKVSDYFKGVSSFIVHNADVFTDLDLTSLLNAHDKSNSIATLAVMNRPTDRALLFDDSDKLVGWENAKEAKRDLIGTSSTFTPLGFSGIQVLSPEIFDFMTQETGQFSIIRSYMNAARSGKKVAAYRMDHAYWIDAGTPERLEELEQYMTTSFSRKKNN